ncbi:cation:proton antiporter [Frondihabitans australicus]|uniref:Potassium/proton antiporter membrane subunit (CPA2 family) n=1 Tax=Frondihabitans australicus TaxID=386892 RepID=A0A495IID2_9MICO|nr:cation:proton antiporter [Frondihabitans australicus]RKR75460.1 potassium/proton antiporter membrane subunit (CPA2 family) [Frondihabitans australicus]
MHLGEELLVLGVLFLIAYVLGRLAKLIGLPTIPVYMVVGLIASPHVGFFPLSFGQSKIELIAIFGLILLLFNLGLEFDQDEFFGNIGKLVLSGGSYIFFNMALGLAFGFWLGWGTREALIIAGITATSSSAIVTKLLIELGRLANSETPMILGVTVVEDIFIAIYLAIVSVVLSGETDPIPVIGKLLVAFLFLIVMFTIARWGGRVVSRLMRTRDDELFTVLFFGLAVMFAGIGEILGVTDAIGAFLIGLVCGATRFRSRIEGFALPMRDVFAAFFFLNFGLGLNPSLFPEVLWPALGAVLMTMLINLGAGQFVAWLNRLGPRAGLNTSFILHNRGEFALILATLSASAGLDDRITPFAGLYVLVMAIVGPLLASNSERIGGVLFSRKKVVEQGDRPPGTPSRGSEEIALMEAALAGEGSPGRADEPDDDLSFDFETDDDAPAVVAVGDRPDDDAPESFDLDDDPFVYDPAAEQAGLQSDQRATRTTEAPPETRQRDPEY